MSSYFFGPSFGGRPSLLSSSLSCWCLSAMELKGLALVSLVEGFQVFVLASEAAFRGDVYNEQDLSSVDFEVVGFAADWVEGKMVQGIGH